jgi:AraC-like DNA-binding protein
MLKSLPLLEHIEPSYGNSFTLNKFEPGISDNSAPKWHFHPEVELVFIKEGSGKRHIGNHISQYYNGDLIMVGPNLPHYGFTDRFSGTKTEIVLQFKEDFLGNAFFDKIELQVINRLIEKSKSGLSFSGNAKTEVGERLESLFYMNHFEKLIELLKILFILANTREVEVLNATGIILETTTAKASRLDEIFSYVRKEFQNEITLEEVADQANMTVPSFCRFFKTNTGKTFISFLNEFRITHACKLLAETELSVTNICFESGFNNFSHFTKIFKRVTNMSPSEYRKLLGQMVVHEV